MAIYNEFGFEVPDPVPVALPVGVRHEPSLVDIIKQYVRTQLVREVPGDPETWEEANDFDVDEDPDPLSRYQIEEAPPEFLKEAQEPSEPGQDRGYMPPPPEAMARRLMPPRGIKASRVLRQPVILRRR